MLQAIFFYDTYLSVMLFLLTIFLTFFKLFALGFPKGQFFLECVIGCFYGLVCYGRISTGVKGNAIESFWTTMFMIFLSAFSLLCNLYFLLWQTYM